MTTTDHDLHPMPTTSSRRDRGLCTSCRCTAVGSRVCQRGENAAHPYLQVSPLMSAGLQPRPFRLDPPNRVSEALAHFAASVASQASALAAPRLVHDSEPPAELSP